jgi:hypothetical protein
MSLMNGTQLAVKSGAPEDVVMEALKGAGIKPAYADGAIQIYEAEQALDAVKKHLERIAEEEKRGDPRYLAGQIDRLHTHMAVEFKSFEEWVNTLVEGMDRLSKQNALLLKAVEKLGVRVPAEKPSRLRVAIIGLINDQRAMIEKEYSAKFDLRLYLSDDANNFASSVSNCDVAINMTKFTNHSIEDQIKASRTKLVRCTGGMTTLRETLDNIHAHMDDYRKELTT